MSNRQLIEALNSYRDDVLTPCMGDDLEIPPEEVEGLISALSQAADALSAYEWRYTELPPCNQDLLVKYQSGVRIANLSTATGKWWSEYGHELESPEAWMPLPKPITGDE